MNPFASWLLSKFKQARNFRQEAAYEEALNEMGVWLYDRPPEITLEAMSRDFPLPKDCSIYEEFLLSRESITEVVGEPVRTVVTVFVEDDDCTRIAKWEIDVGTAH